METSLTASRLKLIGMIPYHFSLLSLIALEQRSLQACRELIQQVRVRLID